jgi:hypothetical protein
MISEKKILTEVPFLKGGSRFYLLFFLQNKKYGIKLYMLK